MKNFRLTKKGNVKMLLKYCKNPGYKNKILGNPVKNVMRNPVKSKTIDSTQVCLEIVL